MTTALSTHTTTSGIPGAEWLTPQNMEQGMSLATMMAKCSLVPDHLKNKPDDCFPILVQALRWKMDPFAVAQCTAVVRGKLCYEGKLVHAVLIAMGAIDGRLTFEYKGTGDLREVTVTGTPRGDKARSITGTVRQWQTENGNWKKDPDMMLAYRGTRAWARLYCPDAMMGVYTPDELDDGDVREVKATVHAEPEPARQREAPAAVDAAATAPAAGSEPKKEADAKLLPTVERCVERFAALWKVNEAGLAAAKQLRVDWKLGQITELAGANDDIRQSFLDQVEAALVKAQGAA
jgi:hypothetical protein